MNLLEQILLKSQLLSQSSAEKLSALWHKSRSLKPKELLVNHLQTDTHLYFIVSGCVRLFVVDSQVEEKNIGFGYTHSFITNFQSFITGKPSMLSIEAILETEVLYISKDAIMEVVNQDQEIANWYRSLLEKTLAGHIQRQIELLTLSPQERYEVFQNRSGHLINSIPLKHIASYLMMTPETLSRIRSKNS